MPIINTKFSIYDIDHADPQRASGRIDYVKVTGYYGAVPIMPVLVNPSSAPWNTVSGNTVYGFADYPLSNYTLPYNSQNEDHGTINVYFQGTIDKIVIEYEEWSPVLLGGKGISDATPPNSAFSEALWIPRAPTNRGISIGSIDYTVDAATILPLRLIDFRVTEKNCSGLLTWETTFEQDLGFFEIEYSANAANFQMIGKVNPSNNIAGAKYNFSVPRNFGSGYYRLKMADTDGKFQYSEIRSITFRCNNHISWSFVSNPVRTGDETAINLFVQDGPAKKANIISWDMSGRKILQQNVMLQPGQNTYILKTAGLKSGTYITGIYDQDNNPSGGLQKLIVQ